MKKGHDEYRRPAFFVSKPDAMISDKTSGVADKPYPAYFYERLRSKLNLKMEEAIGHDDSFGGTSQSEEDNPYKR